MKRVRTGRWAADGFSVIEVVVALVIFAVGLLGVAGIVATAAESLRRARALAWAAYAAGQVADSLTESGVREGGERILPEGRVRWTILEPGPPARVMIQVSPRLAAHSAYTSAGSGGAAQVIVVIPSDGPSAEGPL